MYYIHFPIKTQRSFSTLEDSITEDALIVGHVVDAGYHGNRALHIRCSNELHNYLFNLFNSTCANWKQSFLFLSLIQTLEKLEGWSSRLSAFQSEQ